MLFQFGKIRHQLYDNVETKLITDMKKKKFTRKFWDKVMSVVKSMGTAEFTCGAIMSKVSMDFLFDDYTPKDEEMLYNVWSEMERHHIIKKSDKVTVNDGFMKGYVQYYKLNVSV